MKYTFNLLLSFLLGMFAKIYDDIIDEKLNIDIIYVEVLKYSIITICSILFYNSFVFASIFGVVGLLTFLGDTYYTSKLENCKDTTEQKDLTSLNDGIWIYSFALSGLFIIYHSVVDYSSFNIIYNYKNIGTLVNTLICSFILVIDIYFTPEHSSDNKLYVRLFVLLFLSTFFYYMTLYSEYIYEGDYGIILTGIGYFASSVCFLTLNKFHVLDYLKHKKE